MIRITKLNLTCTVITLALTGLAIGLSVKPPSNPASPALVAVQRSDGNDYPAYLANAPTDSIADPWGAGNRECTSYASWKVNQAYQDMPYWTGAQSNALNWPKLASTAGFKVGTTPAIGSVAVFEPGWAAQATINGKAMAFTETQPTGHVAWVEAVNPDGSILVSQYDGVSGQFSRTTYPSAGLQFIYFNQRAN